MKKYLAIILILLTGTTVQLEAQDKTQLESAVYQALRSSNMKHATLAVSVYNISQNKEVYKHDAQRFVCPASINKLFVTAAGFDILGSDFRFKTRLGYTGKIDRDGVLHGNLHIVGGGDPLLGSYRYRQTSPDTLFKTWTQAVKNYGIRNIDGRVCYDASIFDDTQLHDSWQWGDVGNYYGAGVSGLNFHENMYFAFFTPGKRVGFPASIDRMQPKNLNVRNQNEVTTGPEGSGDHVIIYGEPQSSIRHYKGTVPLGSRNFSVRGALPNPAGTCAEMFANYLRTHDVNISSNVNEVTNRKDSVNTLLDYYSNTYHVIAQYTNLTSNNIYAESIFKYLGFKRHGKGTYANAIKAMNDFFKSHKLDVGSIIMADGCGLSRQNRVTGEFICKFLTEVYNSNIFDDFSKSLAVAGKNGTAKNLLSNLPDDVEMLVKSGSMEGVKGYAGYAKLANGDWVSYCVICNDFTGSTQDVNGKLEKILKEIVLLK